jgi:hypothetical protein
MAFRKKIYLILLGIIVQLWFFGDVQADELQPRDNTAERERITAPEPHDMSLVSFSPWVVEGEVLGAMAAYVYTDVTTERPADYWELYDNDGDLLAVSWFDRFGVQMTAVDRGILEEKDRLEGILVVVLTGDSI